MKNVILTFILLGILLTSCKDEKHSKKNIPTSKISANNAQVAKENAIVYQTDRLIIKKLSNRVYMHTSLLKTEKYGNVPCNGMLVFNKKEAVVFDTPANMTASKELIHYITEELHGKIKAVVPTHFHQDCIAGIKAFQSSNIPVYASEATVKLLQERENTFSMGITGFEGVLVLNVGGEKVYATFFGEGHTKDNIIAYFPTDSAIFGGCLIKEIGALKGNLADANVDEWPKTVRKLKRKYPNIKIVIPGHGKAGGKELFDYTIDLFQ